MRYHLRKTPSVGRKENTLTAHMHMQGDKPAPHTLDPYYADEIRKIGGGLVV